MTWGPTRESAIRSAREVIALQLATSDPDDPNAIELDIVNPELVSVGVSDDDIAAVELVESGAD
jgi:hypothetical protein